MRVVIAWCGGGAWLSESGSARLCLVHGIGGGCRDLLVFFLVGWVVLPPSIEKKMTMTEVGSCSVVRSQCSLHLGRMCSSALPSRLRSESPVTSWSAWDGRMNLVPAESVCRPTKKLELACALMS